MNNEIPKGRAKGGYARAACLSPNQRSAIASAAELIDLYQRKADWFAYARSRETSQVVASSDGLPHLPFNQPLPR